MQKEWDVFYLIPNVMAPTRCFHTGSSHQPTNPHCLSAWLKVPLSVSLNSYAWKWKHPTHNTQSSSFYFRHLGKKIVGLSIEIICNDHVKLKRSGNHTAVHTILSIYKLDRTFIRSEMALWWVREASAETHYLLRYTNPLQSYMSTLLF